MKNDNFEPSHSAEKSKRGNSLGFLNICYVAKFFKKLKGDPFETLKNFRKKNEKSKNKNFEPVS